MDCQTRVRGHYEIAWDQISGISPSECHGCPCKTRDTILGGLENDLRACGQCYDSCLRPTLICVQQNNPKITREFASTIFQYDDVSLTMDFSWAWLNGWYPVESPCIMHHDWPLHLNSKYPMHLPSLETISLRSRQPHSLPNTGFCKPQFNFAMHASLAVACRNMEHLSAAHGRLFHSSITPERDR